MTLTCHITLLNSKLHCYMFLTFPQKCVYFHLNVIYRLKMALNRKKTWSSLLIIRTDLSWLNRYILLQWQLHLVCLASIVKIKLQEYLKVTLTEATFVPESNAVHGMICLWWRWEFSLLLWHICRCHLVFLNTYLNTIDTLLSILGIYHER